MTEIIAGKFFVSQKPRAPCDTKNKRNVLRLIHNQQESPTDGKRNLHYQNNNDIIQLTMNTMDPSKRKRPSEESNNEYEGYTLDPTHPSIDRVDANISAQDFFHHYISKRRPCIIKLNPSKPTLSAQLICQVAGDAPVQVERRANDTQTYGQNRSKDYQVNLTIHEFAKHLEDETARELYYLSTQESDDEVFSTPCRQLLQAGHISETLEWAGSLVLQSCNLWWGASRESSSGLHHDFHDNFYLVQVGIKRFRLFPPSCKVKVNGVIDKVHRNGLISYRSSPTRADGVPLPKRTKLDDDKLDDEESDDEEDEDQAFIGKGFDYESDNSEDFDLDENAIDDYDDIVGNEEESEGGDNDDDCDTSEDAKIPAEKQSTNARPDHFSPLHPDEIAEPGLTIEIRPGECLYLPCGWFHHVTSLCNSGECHMALNYWYHPPDRLDSFEDPYVHRRDLCLSKS